MKFSRKPADDDSPPAYDDQAPKAHDWQTAVPDTALFPEPPKYFGAHERSPASNADSDSAEAGDEWCRQYPLARPLAAEAVTGELRLLPPFDFYGSIRPDVKGGRWRVSTAKGSPDRCIIGYPPMYLAAGPRGSETTTTTTTIYYEARLLSSSPCVSMAMGFTALPYPSFRMPGWHRGSLAVHGDDGRRYVDDGWGGKDFTAVFERGRTYGVGMTMGGDAVDVFFTCDGVRVGGWDLHEETDAEEELPVTGLEGYHDVSCALGTFDGLEFEVVLEKERWVYRGDEVV